MARDGYLIMDSDLHMMEPDDLWARYLDGPHRAKPAALLRRAAGRSSTRARKTRATPTSIMGMEVQGLAIPAHAGADRRDRLEPRAAPPQPRPAPAFQCRAGARLRRGLDPDGDGYRGDRRRGDVRHARPADPVPRRSRARLRRGAGARLQQLGRRLLQDRPAAAQIRRAARDARRQERGRGGAALRHRTGRGRGHRHAEPGQRPASARRGRSSRYGTRSKSSTCRSAFTRPATPR